MRSQVNDLKPLQVSGMKGFASHRAPETAVSWGGVCGRTSDAPGGVRAEALGDGL